MEKVVDDKRTFTEEIKGLPDTGDRISWRAVFAGAVVAMAVQLLFTSLGIAIGMETIDPFLDENPLENMGTATGVWLAVSALISLLVGGYVAGRFSRAVSKFGGAIHGILTWAVVLAASFLLTSTAFGKIYGGFTSVLNSAGSAISEGAEQLSPDSPQINQDTVDRAQREVEQILRQTNDPALQPQNLRETGQDLQAIGVNAARDVMTSPSDAAADLNQALDKAYNRTDQVVAAADKDALASALAARTNMSKERAEMTVSRWSTQYEQSKVRMAQLAEQAEQAAFDASRALETAAWIAFAAALISFLAAAIAGVIGHGQDPDLKFRRTYHDEIYRQDRPVVAAYPTKDGDDVHPVT